MIEIVLALLLGVHLWCVNISSCAPLLAMVALWTGAEKTNRENGEASNAGPCPSDWLVWQGIKYLKIGIVLGLILAGAMWLANDRELFSILGRFQYKITWGLIELVFYVLCMAIYIVLLKRYPGRAKLGKSLLAILASTNLLYHFPTLFTVMTMVGRNPELVEGPVGPSEFRTLMLRGHVAALSVHFAFASLAVAAAVALVFISRNRTAPLQQEDSAFSRWSAAIGLVSTGLQIPVGIWLLTRLEPAAQSRVMGENLVATVAFGASILLGFRLMNRFGSVVVAPHEVHQQAKRIQHLLWLIIALMCITLQTTS